MFLKQFYDLFLGGCVCLCLYFSSSVVKKVFVVLVISFVHAFKPRVRILMLLVLIVAVELLNYV